MTESEKFAVAAHLYVLLRRKIGRAIDTVWMVQNNEYAREILRIARGQADADIARLADRFERLAFGAAPAPVATVNADDAVQRAEAAFNDKYKGSLR